MMILTTAIPLPAGVQGSCWVQSQWGGVKSGQRIRQCAEFQPEFRPRARKKLGLVLPPGRTRCCLPMRCPVLTSHVVLPGEFKPVRVSTEPI
eukprot:450674-Rhodomonas_salina.4